MNSPAWSVVLPRLRFEDWNLLTGFGVFIVVGVLTSSGSRTKAAAICPNMMVIG